MAELEREPKNLPLLLVLREVVTEKVVLPIKRFGHEALLVKPDVSAERWEAIVKVIRKKLPYYEFPLYEKRDGRWRTIR